MNNLTHFLNFRFYFLFVFLFVFYAASGTPVNYVIDWNNVPFLTQDNGSSFHYARYAMGPTNIALYYHDYQFGNNSPQQEPSFHGSLADRIRLEAQVNTTATFGFEFSDQYGTAAEAENVSFKIHDIDDKNTLAVYGLDSDQNVVYPQYIPLSGNPTFSVNTVVGTVGHLSGNKVSSTNLEGSVLVRFSAPVHAVVINMHIEDNFGDLSVVLDNIHTSFELRHDPQGPFSHLDWGSVSYPPGATIAYLNSSNPAEASWRVSVYNGSDLVSNYPQTNTSLGTFDSHNFSTALMSKSYPNVNDLTYHLTPSGPLEDVHFTIGDIDNFLSTPIIDAMSDGLIIYGENDAGQIVEPYIHSRVGGASFVLSGGGALTSIVNHDEINSTNILRAALNVSFPGKIRNIVITIRNIQSQGTPGNIQIGIGAIHYKPLESYFQLVGTPDNNWDVNAGAEKDKTRVNGNNALADIFPNPVQDVLNIHPQASSTDITSILIYDASGNVVAELFDANLTTQLDVSNYSSGVYIVVLNFSDKATQTIKFVKL